MRRNVVVYTVTGLAAMAATAVVGVTSASASSAPVSAKLSTAVTTAAKAVVYCGPGVAAPGHAVTGKGTGVTALPGSGKPVVGGLGTVVTLGSAKGAKPAPPTVVVLKPVPAAKAVPVGSLPGTAKLVCVAGVPAQAKPAPGAQGK